MAYRLPPLSTLRPFEAAARHLSFKQAAAELHVTPAAVSQQIKTLERFLGVALFVRRPGDVQLSEAGRAMYSHIRDGLNSFAAGLDAVAQRAETPLNVIAPPSFASRWLVPRLPRFAAAYPEVAIRVSSEADNIDGVRNIVGPESRRDGNEVVIRFGTGVYPGFRAEKIQTPAYGLVCSPALLAGQNPLRQPDDLRHHTLIHDESIPVAEKRPSWRAWLALAGVSGIDTERGPRFSNSLLALEAVLDGQGVALILKPQIEADVAAGRLVMPFPISLPSAYSYYLVMPEDAPESGVVKDFCQWLLSEGAAGSVKEIVG